MQPRGYLDPIARRAIGYFRSGWAFLVPYVAIYFGYAGLKWPVNPGTASLAPSLLYIYWLLHAVHVVLAALALREWWRSAKVEGQRPQAEWIRRLLPWVGLALLFWIPGVYLEFPSDPWQHYARLNEWSWHELVTQHSYWKKSSYFLGYSLLGHAGPPITQLRWFDVYYTGCCLLLCWQYYRLARAVGLGEKAALLFVLLNTLTFGNNLFGFYRYYGMSSTVFAQLGTVALTRIVIETLQGRQEQGAGSTESGSRGWFSRLPPPVSRFLPSAGAIIALGVLIAGNHVQGLLISGAGVAAIVSWRLVAWRRSMIGWLALGAVLASVATVWWWPRHPLVDSNFVPEGWMTSWYAFQLFQPSSAGFQRAWVIIGAIGAVNLAAGAWLLLRNHVVGWLTLMPVLLLCLPCFALPFANALATSTEQEGGYIIAFHRVLFAIPVGLALAMLATTGLAHGGIRHVKSPQWLRHQTLTGGIAVALAAFLCLPAMGPGFNRTYNAVVQAPADLSMREPLRALGDAKARLKPEPRLTSSQGISFVADAFGWRKAIYPFKLSVYPPSNSINWAIDEFRFSLARKEPVVAFYPTPTSLVTPGSTIGRLSNHWTPYKVSFEYIYGPGVDVRLRATGSRKSTTPPGWWYFPN